MALRTSFLLLFSLIIVSMGNAQEVWSLRDCIDYAKENSLTMKQAEYSIESARLNAEQSRLSWLPNLNGSVIGGVQFGRTIDPVTNSFDNNSIAFNSFRLDFSMPVFNFGRIRNSIDRDKLALEASKLDADAAFNDMALNIAGAYLQILLAEEQLAAAQKQLEITQQQLDQTDKLIAAGAIPENDRLDVLAALALNEQTIVQAQNAVESNYLLLKQLLELDPTVNMRIEKPVIIIPEGANPDQFSVNEVYATALGTQPQIEATEFRLRSAEESIEIAQSAGLPSISISAGLNTNWSSVAKTVNGFDTQFVPLTVRDPNGNTIVFDIEQEVPNLADYEYPDQLVDNFGQSVGIALSVPIFNGLRNNLNVDRARLNVLSTKVQNDQVKQNLKSSVQRAVADARASRRSYEAAQRSFEAARVAFDNAQRRYDLGATSTFDLTTAKTNLDAAEVEVIRAKYQYLFNLKVVDFYLGNDLRINN